MEKTEAQQIEAGTSINLPFDQLEPVHMPFDRAVAPGQSQSRFYGMLITQEAGCETAQGGMSGTFKPLRPRR
jgi:hypothetical protein